HQWICADSSSHRPITFGAELVSDLFIGKGLSIWEFHKFMPNSLLKSGTGKFERPVKADWFTSKIAIQISRKRIWQARSMLMMSLLFVCSFKPTFNKSVTFYC